MTFVNPFSQMFTKCLQFKIAQKRKKKETKKADVSPYNPLLSKEINKKERKEYNMEYLYTSFNFVYKYILYILLRIKKKELPDDYFVLTIGLPFPLKTQRTIIITEPYPGRYTNHILISDISNLDDELFSWIALAYDFSNSK